MDCLKGKISYRYCPGEDLPGTLFINDLPGISTLLLNDLSTQELETFDAVFRKIERLSLNSFAAKIERAMSENYNTTHSLYASPQYDLIRPLQHSVIGSYVNQVFEIPTSKYTTAKIKDIKFFSLNEYSGAYLEIIDLLSGKTVYFIPAVEVVKGINVVEVDKELETVFKSNYFAVRLNAEFLDLAAFYNDGGGDCGCNGNLRQYPAALTQLFEEDGTTLIALTLEDVRATNNVYLAVDFEYYCDISKYVCANSGMFLRGLLYEYGANILNEALNSDKVTWAVKGNPIQKRETMEEFYNEAANEMRASIKKIPFNSLCADCYGKNGNLSYANMLA
jgi:hypothetical protein